MFNHYSYLYIEDDPLSREIVQLLMGTVLGVERLTMYEDTHDLPRRLLTLATLPDVILLDIHIAPFDGFETLSLLRDDDRFRALKVIAITASVMNEEIERLKQHGFNGAIAKPLDMDIFPNLLARILDGEQVWYIA